MESKQLDGRIPFVFWGAKTRVVFMGVALVTKTDFIPHDAATVGCSDNNRITHYVWQFFMKDFQKFTMMDRHWRSDKDRISFHRIKSHKAPHIFDMVFSDVGNQYLSFFQKEYLGHCIPHKEVDNKRADDNYKRIVGFCQPRPWRGQDKRNN